MPGTPARSFCRPEAPLGILWAIMEPAGGVREPSKTFPGCLPDGLEHPNVSRAHPGIDIKSIWDAPGQLWATPETDVRSILALFSLLILRASWQAYILLDWPAQGKPLDCRIALASELACNTAYTSLP